MTTTTPTTCPEWCRDHGREHADAGGEVVHTWGRSCSGELEVEVSRVDIDEPAGEVHSQWWVGFNQGVVDVLDLTGICTPSAPLQAAEGVLTATGCAHDQGGDLSLLELVAVASSLGLNMSVLLCAAHEHKAGLFEVPLDPAIVEAVREAFAPEARG